MIQAVILYDSPSIWPALGCFSVEKVSRSFCEIVKKSLFHMIQYRAYSRLYSSEQ